MADILAKLPEIAAQEWEERKGRIARAAATLPKRRDGQVALRQWTTRALIEETISKEEAGEMNASIKEDFARIDEQITALDAERSKTYCRWPPQIRQFKRATTPSRGLCRCRAERRHGRSGRTPRRGCCLLRRRAAVSPQGFGNVGALHSQALVMPRVVGKGTFPSNLFPCALPCQSLFHSTPFAGLQIV